MTGPTELRSAVDLIKSNLVTIDQARRFIGSEPWGAPHGNMTFGEYWEHDCKCEEANPTS